MTQKRADFILFNSIIDKIIKKEHLTNEGLKKIINIRASINTGITPILIEAFPLCEPVPKPVVVDQVVPDPYWIAGFTSGEGCFLVKLKPSKSNKLKWQVNLCFDITQHIRDNALIVKLQTFFGCGTIVKNRSTIQYRIRNFYDLENKLFPLLDKYPLITIKSLDAKAFRDVHTLIKLNSHKTLEGLEKISAIKATINRERLAQYKS